METSLSWVATIATIAAATITASNLGSRITGYGFIVFTVGSIAWFSLGIFTGQPALVWTNAALTFLNLFGIWRWLGRQAKVEEGAKAASKASETARGETLFPVSLLTRAKLMSNGGELATCVDAMAGCESGMIVYLMVSEGGVAGAGETLRRIPWVDIRAEGDQVVTRLDRGQLMALEPVPKDQWPVR
jgi:hypothetical protein